MEAPVRLRHGALLALLFAALWLRPAPPAPAAHPLEIVLLTTNDLHGVLEQRAVQTQRGTASTGGFACLAATMESIERRERGAVVRLNSGDTLSGPYVEQFGGAALLDALALMGIDAAAPGNHEFDRGPADFERALRGCPFPMIATNIEIDTGKALAGSLAPYCLIERAGARLLVLGIVTPELQSLSSPGADVRILPPESPILRDRITSIISQHTPDLVIALTHVGLQNDLRLARHIPDIDVICGGHSHDHIPSGREIRIEHAGNRETVIVQAGSGGSALGMLRIGIEGNSRPAYQWRLLSNERPCRPDPKMEQRIASFRLSMPPAKTVTAAREPIDCRAVTVRSREAAIGSFIADSLREYFTTDAAVYNGGGIRGDRVIPAGTLTDRDVATMLPYDNRAVVVSMQGSALRQVLERGVSGLPQPWGGFLQVSGLRLRVNTQAPGGSAGRIESVDVLGADGRYHPLEDGRRYRVATNSFLAQGGNGYRQFSEARIECSQGMRVRDIVMLRLASQEAGSLRTDGRISLAAPVRQP